MKIFGGIAQLLVSFFAFAIYMAGSHGHLRFRPHMTEDWIIWGIGILFGAFGFISIYKGIKQTSNKDK